MSVSTFEELTKGAKPQRSLLSPVKQKAGAKPGHGHNPPSGGGHKRRYRVIDFRRDNYGVKGRIETIEYDPNRSAQIACVVFIDGERRYILAPEGVKVNDRVISGPRPKSGQGTHCPSG